MEMIEAKYSHKIQSEIQVLESVLTDHCVCSVCLDTLNDTHIVPECAHRFCGSCIKDSLRRCANVCPQCRIRIPTKRHVREDPTFDALINGVLGSLNLFHELQNKICTDSVSVSHRNDLEDCQMIDYNNDQSFHELQKNVCTSSDDVCRQNDPEECHKFIEYNNAQSSHCENDEEVQKNACTTNSDNINHQNDPGVSQMIECNDDESSHSDDDEEVQKILCTNRDNISHRNDSEESQMIEHNYGKSSHSDDDEMYHSDSDKTFDTDGDELYHFDDDSSDFCPPEGSSLLKGECKARSTQLRGDEHSTSNDTADSTLCYDKSENTEGNKSENSARGTIVTGEKTSTNIEKMVYTPRYGEIDRFGREASKNSKTTVKSTEVQVIIKIGSHQDNSFWYDEVDANACEKGDAEFVAESDSPRLNDSVDHSEQRLVAIIPPSNKRKLSTPSNLLCRDNMGNKKIITTANNFSFISPLYRSGSPSTPDITHSLLNFKNDYKPSNKTSDKKSSNRGRFTLNRTQRLMARQKQSASNKRIGRRTKVRVGFEGNFKKLLKFKEEHGHCNVFTKYKDDVPLGAWSVNMRQGYKAIKQGNMLRTNGLNAERIKRLEAIGFVWKMHPGGHFAKSWDERFSDLLAFKKRYGHCRVTRTLGGELREWVNRVRQLGKQFRADGGNVEGKGRYNGLMNEERFKQLSDIGFVWDVTPGGSIKTFEERVEDLLAFEGMFGHMCVPVTFDRQLSQWISNMRAGYIALKKGNLRRTNGMTEEKAERLREIGFIFVGKRGGYHSKTFAERLDDLLAYKNEFGNCDVPLFWKNDWSLGSWCKAMRQARNALLGNGNGRLLGLTEDRVRQLDDIGFSWNTPAGFYAQKNGFKRHVKSRKNYLQSGAVTNGYPKQMQSRKNYLQSGEAI